MIYRIPDTNNWPRDSINEIINDDALRALKRLPDECIALAVTSPPYWNVKDYGVDGQVGQSDYARYIEDLVPIWRETLRILIPNGKLAIVAPIMPLPKSVSNTQHTRHLKNIASDIEQSILAGMKGLNRYSVFIWQKQTSVKMFGSYPYPPNIFEDNTIEFINVLVKDGKPVGLPREAKEASKLTQEQWRNLAMQVWPIYPEDVKRAGGHPAPFPVVLPLRLMLMYTFRKDPSVGFSGDIVLDMFSGSGSTCVAANSAGRNFIGIDLNPSYCQIARMRIAREHVSPKMLFLQRLKVRSAVARDQFSLFQEDMPA
ncbi:site-specific DNA-methyltransferase [bacterium]|nr:site-specific DNA-methyltransferase [bacterium]